MMSRNEIHSDLAIPPGIYLEEVISELGISKEELARRMDRPAPKLSAIYKGEKAITAETALQLEKVTAVPAHIWVGLETEYRLTMARQQVQKNQFKKETGLVEQFCYRELVKLGYVEKKSDPLEKVVELQKYFGVTSLDTVSQLKRYQAFYRTGEEGEKKHSPSALAAWLRMGELEARKTMCKTFDKKALQSFVSKIPEMTLMTPETYLAPLKQMLAQTGVALVIVPHLPKTFAHGATYWMGKYKAVAMITIRRSWADIFWFSLLHELAHILLHGTQRIFVETNREQLNPLEFEQEADCFAADTLIPSDFYSRFLKESKPDKPYIIQYATKLNIHPGIIVGRLQHDKHISNNMYNELRERYQWTS